MLCGAVFWIFLRKVHWVPSDSPSALSISAIVITSTWHINKHISVCWLKEWTCYQRMERSYTVCMFLCLVYIGCRSCCFHYLHVFFWKATVEISFCLNHRNRCAASVWLFASCFTDSVNPLRCMNPEKVWSLALWPSLSKRWSCILHANKTLNFIYFFCLHFFFNWSYLLHYFFKLYFFLVGFDQLLDFFSIIW